MDKMKHGNKINIPINMSAGTTKPQPIKDSIDFLFFIIIINRIFLFYYSIIVAVTIIVDYSIIIVTAFLPKSIS